MKSFGKIAVKTLLDLLEYVIIGIAIFGLTYVFAGLLLRVTGDSMVPNFHDGEQIIAEKISVKFEDPKRGEIIIFNHPTYPGRLVIKRVVGLPGEIIKISAGKIYINDAMLAEEYLGSEGATKAGEILAENVSYEIPGDSYILLGDNRANSTDSREWGPVKRTEIVAKGFLVYYPLSQMRIIK